MKIFNKLISLALVLCGVFNQVFAQKPNIILILADDVSANEFTWYGGTGINTPTLNKMADDGVMFKTAWATPVCGPCRSVLLTGKYACHTGCYNQSVGPSTSTQIFRSNILKGQAIQKAGYATATYGKLHDGGDPKDYVEWGIHPDIL